MTRGYIDQIGAFQYKGHTIEAHVVKLVPTSRKTIPIWTIRVDEDRFDAFPASPGDTEEEVRERLKRWLDEHLR